MEDDERSNQHQEWVADPEKRKQYMRLTTNSIVQNCLTMATIGQLSDQDALELAVCHLEQENKEWFDKLCEMQGRMPPQAIGDVPPFGSAERI